MRYLKINQDILRMFPHFSPIVRNSRFLRNDKVNTFCIHSNLLIEYNQMFSDKLSYNELKFVIMHEYLHFIFGHHMRGYILAKGCPMESELLLNYAFDLEINSYLTNELKLSPPVCVLLPKRFIFPQLLTGESYYGMLVNNVRKSLIKGDFTDDDDRDLVFSEDESDGTNDLFRESILNESDKIKSKGSGHYDGKSEIKYQVVHHDWKSLLKRILIKNVYLKSKEFGYTYSKINRRHSTSDVIYPSPNVSKVIELNLLLMLDVSGSMHADLSKMISYLADLVKFLNKEYKADLIVNLMEVSDIIHSFNKLDLSEYKMVSMGGGTDLTLGLEYVVKEKLKYDTLIMFTDCYTDWVVVPNKSAFVITQTTEPNVLNKCPYKLFVVKV